MSKEALILPMGAFNLSLQGVSWSLKIVRRKGTAVGHAATFATLTILRRGDYDVF